MKKLTLALGTLLMLLAFQNCDFVGSPGSASDSSSDKGITPPNNNGNGELYDGKGQPFVALKASGVCADGAAVESRIDVDGNGVGWLVRDNCVDLTAYTKVTYALDPVQPWILHANGRDYYGIVRSHKSVASAADGSTFAVAGLNSPVLNGALVTKYDRDGNNVWSRRLLDDQNTLVGETTNVVATADGGALVGGYLGAALRPSSGEAGNGETSFVASLASDGFLRWRRGFDLGVNRLKWTNVVADGSGGALAVGAVSSADASLDQGTLVVRLDAFGNVVYQTTFAKAQLSRGLALAVDGTHATLVGLNSASGVTAILTLDATGAVSAANGASFTNYRSAHVTANGDVLLYGMTGADLFIGRLSSDGSVQRWANAITALAPLDLFLREAGDGSLSAIGTVGSGYVNTPFVIALGASGVPAAMKQGTSALRSRVGYYGAPTVSYDARGSSLWFPAINGTGLLGLYRLDLGSSVDWQAAAAPSSAPLSLNPHAVSVSPLALNATVSALSRLVSQPYGIILPVRSQLR